MCIVKKPKPVVVNKTDKELPVLRNPFLDGIDPILRARQTGMRSLRIDRVARTKSSPATVARPTATTSTPAPAATVPAASGSQNTALQRAQYAPGIIGRVARDRLRQQ